MRLDGISLTCSSPYLFRFRPILGEVAATDATVINGV
jgi:hypothetical protein